MFGDWFSEGEGREKEVVELGQLVWIWKTIPSSLPVFSLQNTPPPSFIYYIYFI